MRPIVHPPTGPCNTPGRQPLMTAPPQAEPPPLPAETSRARRPRLRLSVTVWCWTVTGICVAMMMALTWTTQPVEFLSFPVEAVVRVGERDLQFVEAATRLPAPEQWVYRTLGYSRDQTQAEILAGYRRVLDHLEGPDSAGWAPTERMAGLRGRVAILLAEQSRWEEAEAELGRLPATPDAEAFRSALSAAYAPEPPPPSPVADLSLLWVDADDWENHWSNRIVQARLADRAGAPDTAEKWKERIRESGLRLVPWVRALGGAEVLVLAAGWTLIAFRWRAVFRDAWAAGGMRVAPWSFGYGSGVLVRCLTLAVAVQTAMWFSPSWVLSLSTLAAGLPALLLAHVYFFRPDGTDMLRAFGLRPPELSWLKVGAYALGLTAVDQAGCLLLQGLADAWGIDHLWEEAIDETILFGPWWEAALLTLDGAIGAPVLEEIGFRGLLYVTLRSRLRPLPAAAASAVIFGFAHLYSLAGFLEVTWTGFILAVGYERCRSLWPCIAAHAYNNLFYFAALWGLYR